MSTFSNSCFYGGSFLNNFMSVVFGVHKGFLAAGWVRSSDTGQVTPSSTVVNITSASWNGATATYTYNATTQAGTTAVAVGQQIHVVGCTTVGLNGTFTVTAIGGSGASSTFSAANATAAGSESETANTAYGVVNTVVSITHANGTGSVVTFTYDDTTRTGFQLEPGMSITVAGCTTSGYNTTYNILTTTGAGTSTATFTANGSTAVNEAESGATGTVAADTASSTKYDIWTTNDSISSTFKVYFKFTYSNTTTNQTWVVNIGTGTNGAGTLNGIIGTQISSTTTNIGQSQACNIFGSGDAGNMHMVIFGNPQTNVIIVNLERSHDTSGNDTNDYYSFNFFTGSVNNAWQQSIFRTGGATTQETGGWAAVLTKTASTGNFGANTLVSPIFPVVGAVGNPTIGLLLYRATDFADNVQAQATIYGTLHTYIAVSTNNANLWNGAQASGALVRYE